MSRNAVELTASTKDNKIKKLVKHLNGPHGKCNRENSIEILNRLAGSTNVAVEHYGKISVQH